MTQSVAAVNGALYHMKLSRVTDVDCMCAVVVRCGRVGTADAGRLSLPRGRQLGHHRVHQVGSATPEARILSSTAVRSLANSQLTPF